MQNIEQLKDEIIGQKIKALYHTPKGDGEELIPGLGNFYTFDTVIVLENEKLYRLGDDYLIEWLGKDELVEVTHQNWNLPDDLIFNGKCIVDIVLDKNKLYYILLENQIIINHTSDLGCELFIRKYDDIIKP
ncbi:hypothetical protein SAMN05216474_1029 [Lishizhenia tianjinensis]|uniref:Uncharacterized protein n=1 Tax=Lishizhenia tianjinensis TaxID=477690 RepID=A0A1I6YMQ7_9FLAO|nr:hypothetical protein [Lishizhenia tianjinensis]SFT51756.1 hypothetical protein SAMN05216474_1029 [Lishizhenia tianjinensis]